MHPANPMSTSNAAANSMSTYGSPITKLSPALMEGTKPKEPTKAAAASLRNLINQSGFIQL